MSKEQLLFCPLGGSGEIGGNMNLYSYGKKDDQKWIIVDMGVSFADDSVPGVDLIMPDAGFIIDKKDDLLGIVLTHAHEDHIGAVPYLLKKLGNIPIYTTPFTASVLRRKFESTGVKDFRIHTLEYDNSDDLDGRMHIWYVSFGHPWWFERYY